MPRLRSVSFASKQTIQRFGSRPRENQTATNCLLPPASSVSSLDMSLNCSEFTPLGMVGLLVMFEVPGSIKTRRSPRDRKQRKISLDCKFYLSETKTSFSKVNARTCDCRDSSRRSTRSSIACANQWPPKKNRHLHL